MKILISKPKKEFVKDLGKEISIVKMKKFYVDDSTKDYSTHYGTIKNSDLNKKSGSVVKSDQGKEFILLDADFIDEYKRIKRTSQIMTLKDIGYIAAQTGIGKRSKVVDAGTGCGGNSIYLAHLCKEVISYDINSENIKVAKDNIKNLGLKNIKVKNKDFFKGIDEKDIDLIILDLPCPKKAVKSAEKSLRVGGYLVVYSPQITQTNDFVNAVKKNDNFLYEKTVELMERNWKIDKLISRPRSQGIGHTGFLSFVRRV
ncbi:methyltransferase domain-containing protein [Candidatus Woesearchaeota archaeon]|nr:methyltransferase domain-containing protein [Candidatus Woesearchaeota archaeon]